MDKKLEKELIKKIEPYCDIQDEINAVLLYLDTDNYRKKLIDFIDISKERGNTITKDQFMTLVVILSNEEENSRK